MNDAGRRDELIAFLKSKRWFGEKAAVLRDARFRDVIPVEWPNSDKPFAVTRVDVDTDAGSFTYQLFLERGTQRLGDALEDPDFRRGLVDAFVQDLSFGDDVRWVFESAGETPLVTPPAADITLSRSEQSNSSVIVDQAAILKLFRKLAPGVHPDVEVTRFLTIERGFVHVPVLLGTIRFEDASGTMVAGMMQELVPGAVDAWRFALERSKDWLGGTGDERTPPFAAEAEQLGEITRAMHEALASGEPAGDFAMRPVTDAALRTWTDQVRHMIQRATASLQRASSIAATDEQAADAARALRQDGGAAFVQRAEGWVAELGADRGAMARTHGDYHLGQVIRSGAGKFLIIDFEGEPARPIEERRAHQSPLRDVAGMLRSFAYAAAAGSAGSARDARRASAWEQHMRDAFLRGYFRDTDGRAGLLPASRDNARRLLALFEAEKVFYELQYELDHRPDWVWIPLRGIGTLAP